MVSIKKGGVVVHTAVVQRGMLVLAGVLALGFLPWMYLVFNMGWSPLVAIAPLAIPAFLCKMYYYH